MLLIYQGDAPTPPSPAWDCLPQEEKAAVYVDYKAVNETAGVTPGFRLQAAAMAKTVRVEDGEARVTDGPFGKLEMAVSAFLFLEAEDLDAAIELATRIPAARMGGAVEVRPIAEW